MSFAAILKSSEKFLIDNSPTILTAIGVLGTVGTAVLTGKATLKAADILREEKIAKIPDGEVVETLDGLLTKKECIKLVWKQYLPPVAAGVLTITAIIAANRISLKRAAAMAAAYSISEKRFAEYRDKVGEKFGIKKEQTVRDEIAQDQVNLNSLNAENREIIFAGNKGGEVLCFDSFTGRYFMSSVEEIKKAENEINYLIIHNDSATLTDFYNRVGLCQTTYSEEVGWTTDALADFKLSTTLSDEAVPCLVVTYNVTPIREYHRR